MDLSLLALVSDRAGTLMIVFAVTDLLCKDMGTAFLRLVGGCMRQDRSGLERQRQSEHTTCIIWGDRWFDPSAVRVHTKRRTLYILNHLSVADSGNSRSQGSVRRWHRGREDRSMRRRLERHKSPFLCDAEYL